MVDVKKRLVQALRSSTTLGALRTELVLLASDLQDEQGAPTVRSISPAWRTQTGADEAPETERDSAPSWPVDSEIGREYGV